MAEQSIVVVEDEEDILELLEYHLSRDGYRVTTVADGERALQTIPRVLPDLILLDLMLPGVNGLDICRHLKGDAVTTGIPIIMLTAKGEESDMVTGLELGADDYVTKPFSVAVLLARIRAVLRRRREPLPDGRGTLRVHDLVIDPARHEARLHNEPMELTFTEFGVLHFLAGRPGWVMTRDQIIDAVRGEGYAVTDRSVDVQIVGLRKRLGDCADYIQTVRGVGYRFRD
ncbi:MAG: response regulator [Lentisphaerae bacterium]|nr:response regulator [Lentisphaerota bacterium]